MAERILLSVASSLVNTLASLAFKEIASICGVESEIDWLKKTVKAIKAELSDAAKKQQTDQRIRLWIRDLKQILYEADELLDDFHTDYLLCQRDGMVRKIFSLSNPIYRREIANKIRNIREKFNTLTETMSKLSLDKRVVVEMKHEKSNWRETCSYVLQEDIVGREGNKKDIIDLLLNHNNDNSNQNVSLVAVVGIGGLGKTALAQLVFNDADVKRFFAKRIWVCVSQDFAVNALVKLILESLLDKKEEDQPLELLQNKLRRNLDGQKFLLVLDDIWKVDPLKWQDLKNFLMCGSGSSKILLTTRNQAIANVMGVETPYVLKGLTPVQSWTLFKSLAFDKDKPMTKNLESIGQTITRKCAGVPLAIRVIGSLLRTKSWESDWEAILEGDFWKSCEVNNSIMPILRLSYDSLADELKQCFVYCSLYPKDWRYKKEELIDLWMANDFLQKQDKKQCLEDTGEEYVRILLMKSLLQDVETDALGEITYFKMHDLMHDLSQSIGSFDYCLNVEGSEYVVGCPLRASFEKCKSDNFLGIFETFLEIKRVHGRNPADLSRFKCLRSLNLSWCNMRDLDESIGKLRHLRYLDLSYCLVLTCLPNSISDLINLQTLRLEWCTKLEFSVDIITKLTNLRHLTIHHCKAFENGMPTGLSGIIALQRLSNFIVCDDKDKEKAKLNELKELNLRGRLTIENLGSVRDVEESKDVNLRAKKNLISLCLDWGVNSIIMDSKIPFSLSLNCKWEHISTKNDNNAMKLLENLRPHENLKALSIKGYPGVHLPDFLLSYTNLVQLEFLMGKCQYLIGLEGLVFLKTLHIGVMNDLECISYKGCSSSTNILPSLEELKIESCDKLRGWEREENVQNARDKEGHNSLPSFPRLSSLLIDHCPKLSCMPTFPKLVRQLTLRCSGTKPLLDTLNVTTNGPSTSNHVPASLSMLESLHIEGIDLKALPEEWMQNLSSLKSLSIRGFSSLEEPLHHMRNLRATLENFTIDSCGGNEDYMIQRQNLGCLNSLQAIYFNNCSHLMALPEWFCHLHSLRFIVVNLCGSLKSFPKGMCHLTNLQTLQVNNSPNLEERCQRGTGAEWPKIAHIPTIWINWKKI